MGKMSDDFADFMVQTCTIQPFIRNDGYKDTFGTAVSYSCAIEYKVFNITKADGQPGVTTAQVYLDAGVTVGLRDKITFNGLSPKILRIAFDYDAEDPSDEFGVIVYT
jgi:hypothetical protein